MSEDASWQWEMKQAAQMADRLRERLERMAAATDVALRSPAFGQALQQAKEQSRVLMNQLELTAVRMAVTARKMTRRPAR